MLNAIYSFHYCRWTVIQRRFDGSVDFAQDWNAYKTGFGSASGEYWIGNDYLAYLTNTKTYKLHIELEDWEGESRYAAYSPFVVSPESDKYRLSLGVYSGNASSSESKDKVDGFLYLNNMQFSTYDQDNDGDTRDCIAVYGYGGFWYTRCTSFGPNNYYGQGSDANPSGVKTYNKIRWDDWHGNQYSLKTVTMMIRPV